MEANGRFINRLPGYRQGMILAPLSAWLLLPGSGAFGLRTLGSYDRRLVSQRSLAQRASKLGHVPLGVTAPVTVPEAGQEAGPWAR